ncbi:MAG TPA: DUF1259 domain-containing protein [Gemmatimonadales bacterium]|nr:DUF1259 domain-containing protein [Gemmatimonadales bacterium]
MKMSFLGISPLLLAILISPTALLGQVPDSATWEEVGNTLGTRPVAQTGVYRYNFPRTDLVVQLGGAKVAPALALTSWAGFAPDSGSTMVMGDLVVTAAELPTVLATLDSSGIEVTAVHNHLVGEEPRVMYVHFHGHGAPRALAAGLARVFGVTATPRPVISAPPAPVTIDTAQIRAAFQIAPKANGATASVGIPLLTSEIRMDGRPVSVALGLTSPINFQQVSTQRWLSTGDFAVSSTQVQPIVKALVEAGITPTAIHSHLVGETPTVYFIHFWADGTPTKVLSGLSAAVKAARQ